MLILSIVALFLGPLLYQWLRKGGWIARTVEHVIVAALVLVVVFLLVPESLAGLGYVALVLIGLGYLVPGLLESVVKQAAHAFHLVSLLLALLGLALHALLDGAGLAGSQRQGDDALGLAIVLHRVGMGLVLWLMVVPALGRRIAVGVLSLVAVLTVAGFLASEHLLPLETEGTLLALQSLVTGTIIHSLVHRGHTGPAGSEAASR